MNVFGHNGPHLVLGIAMVHTSVVLTYGKDFVERLRRIFGHKLPIFHPTVFRLWKTCIRSSKFYNLYWSTWPIHSHGRQWSLFLHMSSGRPPPLFKISQNNKNFNWKRWLLLIIDDTCLVIDLFLITDAINYLELDIARFLSFLRSRLSRK